MMQRAAVSALSKPRPTVIIRSPAPSPNAIDIIHRICGLSGSLSLLADIQGDAERTGLIAAIETGNTPRIFDWAIENFSYQGISDQVARNYLAKNGSATWRSIKAGLTKCLSGNILNHRNHL